MPTPFRVESTDIKALNDLQLTRLLKLLLHLEARISGIAERSVEVALNINVRDGGEDGRIHWNGDPPNTQFLPLNLVQFQNKATTNMGPADCAKETTTTGETKTTTLGLSEKELESMHQNFSSILDYIDTLKEADISSIEKAFSEKVDLILLDFTMPDITGFEACRR